jgi:hypothetical protein
MHFSQYHLENWQEEIMININMDFNCNVWTGIIPLGTGKTFGFTSTRQRRFLLYKICSVSKLSENFLAEKSTQLCEII